MGLGLSGLRLGLGQRGGGASSPYLGLTGAHDYYIDATLGNDANDGSEGAPWASLSKLEAVDAGGGTLRALVKAGTYDTASDHIDFGAGGPNGTLEVAFEPGCIMDGTVHGTTAQNPIYVDSGALTIYGNGLTVQNFNGTTGGSPNGLGYGGSATLIAHDVTVDTVQDGISGHANGAGFFYDCHIKNGYKWCVANVDASTMHAERCVFDMRAPGLAISSANGAQYFEDCVFLAETTDSAIIAGNDQEFVRCQLGTLTAHVTPQTITPGSGTIAVTNSFINVDIQAGGGTTYTRCYGFMSARVRNTAGTFTVQDCVLTGGQNGGTNILYCNSDFGGSCQVLFTDNVIETANQISSFNATQAGYVIAASSSISGNQLFGGAAWDADLAPVISGTITTDPQIGSADSYLMADYASAAGLAGFGSGDVVERPAVIPRALPPQSIFYVDSMNGDDANNGWSQSGAFQTLAAAETAIGSFGTGAWASLALGSEWAEQLDLAVASAKLTTHGTGAVPYIDAAGAVTETWYQPDSGTYPNVWAIDVTHGFTTAQGQSRLPMWEDGALMTRVTSLATLNSTAGASYSPNDENLTPATVTVYIHATGSGNPNSNGRTYEIARRQYGINGAYAGAGMSLTGPLIGGRQSHNDGAFTLGKNSLMAQALVVDGHKHNALQESGICRDSIFMNAQEVGGFLHVFYTPSGVGESGIYQRCGLVGKQAGFATSLNGLYAHDNTNGHDSLSVEQCWFYGNSSAMLSSAKAFTADGCYFLDNTSVGTPSARTVSGTMTLRRSIIRHLTSTRNAGTNNQIQVDGTGTWTFENNASYFPAGASFSNDGLIRALDTTSGPTVIIRQNTHVSLSDAHGLFRDIQNGPRVYTIKDNIAVSGFNGTAFIQISSTGTVSEIDYNIYYCNVGTESANFVVGGTWHKFGPWQALGYDQNSLMLDQGDISLDDLFLNGTAGLAAGDFRLATDTGLTFGDGTPIHERAGVQSHWDWSTGAAAAGAPTKFPTVPYTRANAETYIADPTEWTF